LSDILTHNIKLLIKPPSYYLCLIF